MNACFYIAGAKADILVNRTSAALLERLQYFPARGIGDSMQNPI